MYIDGFNLYFGARDHCGRGTRGWQWLDVRGLVGDSLPSAWTDVGAVVDRVQAEGQPDYGHRQSLVGHVDSCGL